MVFYLHVTVVTISPTVMVEFASLQSPSTVLVEVIDSPICSPPRVVLATQVHVLVLLQLLNVTTNARHAIAIKSFFMVENKSKLPTHKLFGFRSLLYFGFSGLSME